MKDNGWFFEEFGFKKKEIGKWLIGAWIAQTVFWLAIIAAVVVGLRVLGVGL